MRNTQNHTDNYKYELTNYDYILKNQNHSRKNSNFLINIFVYVLLFLVGSMFFSCNNNLEFENNNSNSIINSNLPENTLYLPTFENINNHSNFDIEIKLSALQSVVVEKLNDCDNYEVFTNNRNLNDKSLNEKYINEIPIIKVNNSTLYIISKKIKQQMTHNKNQKSIKTYYKIIIYTPNINQINHNGNGCIYSNTQFTNAKTHINIEGNGKLDININTELLEINSIGNASVIMNGKSQNTKVKLIGNQNVNLSSLQSFNSDIYIGGNSKLSTSTENNLKIEIIGNSEIELLKNPKILNSDITGNGFIRK